MDENRARALKVAISVGFLIVTIISVVAFGVVLGHAARLATRNAQEYHGVE